MLKGMKGGGVTDHAPLTCRGTTQGRRGNSLSTKGSRGCHQRGRPPTVHPCQLWGWGLRGAPSGRGRGRLHVHSRVLVKGVHGPGGAIGQARTTSGLCDTAAHKTRHTQKKTSEGSEVYIPLLPLIRPATCAERHPKERSKEGSAQRKEQSE